MNRINLLNIQDVAQKIGAGRTSIKAAAHRHNIGYFCNGSIVGFDEEQARQLRKCINVKAGNPNFTKKENMKRTHCSVPDAAKILGCTKTWVLKLLNAGTLKGWKLSEKAWCVELKQLEANVKEYRERISSGGVGRPRREVA